VLGEVEMYVKATINDAADLGGATVFMAERYMEMMEQERRYGLFLRGMEWYTLYIAKQRGEQMKVTVNVQEGGWLGPGELRMAIAAILRELFWCYLLCKACALLYAFWIRLLYDGYV